MNHRFEQIHGWLREHKPKVILEIGTWDGKNAVLMMAAASAEKYIGFDLWEEPDIRVPERLDFGFFFHIGNPCFVGNGRLTAEIYAAYLSIRLAIRPGDLGPEPHCGRRN